jgi:hypothetical protein
MDIVTFEGRVKYIKVKWGSWKQNKGLYRGLHFGVKVMWIFVLKVNW